MNFSRIQRHEQGFTLVELLVVIAIIAIITMIAVPMFINQKKKAKDASVLADVKNLANAVQTAMIDCGAADVFQFGIGKAVPLPVSVKKADGSSSATFNSWHTLSSELVEAHGDGIVAKIRTFSDPTTTTCIATGIRVSNGNYLHLTEVTGFENNRFLIYGWNPDGGKYNGETVDITRDTGQLPEAAKDSTVVYDSTTGGISR